MLEELKELETKATPGKWEVPYGINIFAGITWLFQPRNATTNDIALIVAMRNALPELIAEYELSERQLFRTMKERDAALARAEKAEAALDVLAEELSLGSPLYRDFSVEENCRAWIEYAAREAAREAAKRGAGEEV